MLEIARRHKARFMVTSTSECYGDPLVHPQVETYWGNVNPVGVRSCYDESKRYAEALTMAYHRVHGVRTTIARIFNTYGPRMQLKDGRVVPAFIDQALHGEPMTVFGDGTQTRSFCYVRDLVDGLYRLTLSDERYPVNLGNPQELTILEFAERIRRLTGTTAPARIQAAPARRSQAAAAEYRQGEKDTGLGAQGELGRRAQGDYRVLPEPAFTGSRTVRTGATSIQTLAAAALPSCTGLPAIRKRQRVVVIRRHHAHHGARMNTQPVQIFQQPPVAFEDAHHNGIATPPALHRVAAGPGRDDPAACRPPRDSRAGRPRRSPAFRATAARSRPKPRAPVARLPHGPCTTPCRKFRSACARSNGAG